MPAVLAGRRPLFNGKWVAAVRLGVAVILAHRRSRPPFASRLGFDDMEAFPVPGPVLLKAPTTKSLIGLTFETQSIESPIRCSGILPSLRTASMPLPVPSPKAMLTKASMARAD